LKQSFSLLTDIKLGIEVKEPIGKISAFLKQGLRACNTVDEVQMKLVALEQQIVKLEAK
jgi:hypothetical protein